MVAKARVGLIVDSLKSSKQLYDLIALSKTSYQYEVTHLIVQKTSKSSRNILSKALQYIMRKSFRKFINNLSFKLLCRMESLIVFRSSKFRPFFVSYDLAKLGLEVVEVVPNISPSGLVYRYSEFDLLSLKALKLNLLVRGGSGILRGGILDLCENGVISFHHGDNDVNRGGPPGFWEVAKKEKRTGFIVQRLTEELDGGDVLFKGYIATEPLYTLNLIKLYEVANPYIHFVIEKLVSDNSEVAVKPKRPYAKQLYQIPSIYQQLLYTSVVFTIYITKAFRRLTGRRYRWGVAYQFVNNWRDVALRHSKRIPNPSNRFLADPFVISKNGSHFCFLEDYNYKTGRGHISVYEITKDKCTEVGSALKENFHLSYPFLIKFKNDLYMCPETRGAGDIRLYKCIDFPLKWELAKILITNVSAVDTNIFYKNGRWWLLTNLCSSKSSDHSSEMHIFSSKRLLSDNWKPHLKNPIFFDPNLARNGGLLFENKDIYRVFQKIGFCLAGESLGISKITSLNEIEYQEVPEIEVMAEFFDKIIGTHTYSFSEGLLAIDFVEIDKYKRRN